MFKLKRKEESKEVCACCVFFREDFDYGEGIGECRKKSPSLVVNGISRTSVFPPVTSGMWCGEFHAKEN